MPRETIKLSGGDIGSEEFSVVNYGGTSVFLENLRFNHNDISYSIDGACSDVRRDAMIEAFGLFEWMMEYIQFHEVNSEADIDVGCSDDFVMIGEGLFAAGEGGPVRIVNTSRFKVIEKGQIFFMMIRGVIIRLFSCMSWGMFLALTIRLIRIILFIMFLDASRG